MLIDGSSNSTHSSVIQALILFKCIQNHLPISPFLSFHVRPLSKLFTHRSYSTNTQENSQITPFFLRYSLLFLLLLRLLLLLFLLLLLSLTRSPYSPPSLLQLLLHFLAHRIEIPMRHRLLRRQSLLPLTLLLLSLLPHDRTPASSPDSRTAPR